MADFNRPLAADAYKIDRWNDVTGQLDTELHLTPNLFAIEAEITSKTLDEINADAKFLVLWSDTGKSRSVKPAAAELSAVKAWMVSQGCAQNALDSAIGTTVSNRTRLQIAAEIIAHLKKSKP